MELAQRRGPSPRNKWATGRYRRSRVSTPCMKAGRICRKTHVGKLEVSTFSIESYTNSRIEHDYIMLKVSTSLIYRGKFYSILNLRAHSSSLTSQKTGWHSSLDVWVIRSKQDVFLSRAPGEPKNAKTNANKDRTNAFFSYTEYHASKK